MARRVGAIFLALCLVVAFAPHVELAHADDSVPVTGLEITSTTGSFTIDSDGGSLQLGVTVTPSDATNSDVLWTVSPRGMSWIGNNSSYETGINAWGNVTAICNGTVTVTATARDGSGVSVSQDIVITNQTHEYAEVDDLTYDFDTVNKTAKVLEYSDRGTRTSLEIPGEVEYNSVTYDVTSLYQQHTDALFTGDTTIQSVVLPSGLECIPGHCFSGCASLSSVTFTDPGDGYSPTCGYIYEYAFADCTSLKSFDLPVLTGVKLSSVSLKLSDGTDTLANGINGLDKVGITLSSGDEREICPPAVANAGTAMQQSSAIETLFVEAGLGSGARTYGDGISGSNTVVYKTKRAETYDTAWSDAADLSNDYFAIDYYASKDAAEEDDGCADLDTPYRNAKDGENVSWRMHSKRLGRVELKAYTPMSLIATNDSSLATDYLYQGEIPESADAKHDSSIKDNVLMDATEVYNSAHDTNYATGTYVWGFEEPISEYNEGLTDSLYAYPVKADDLSEGVAVSNELTSMRSFTSSVREKHFVKDYWVDNRWYEVGRHMALVMARYQDGFSDDAYFEFVDGEVNLQDMEVLLPDLSTSIPISDCTVSFKNTSGEEVSESSSEMAQGGAFEMSITPNESTGYSGTLTQWILVSPHTATVKSAFSSSSTATSIANNAAVFANNQADGEREVSYGVLVDPDDRTGSLIASSLAGLAESRVTYASGDTYNSASSGFNGNAGITGMGHVFVIGGTDGVSKDVADSVANTKGNPTPVRLDADAFDCADTPAALALAVYKFMKEDGYGYENYYDGSNTWGDTAVLCSPTDSFDTESVANLAYQLKAPVFFTDANGNVEDDTAEALKDFSSIVVAADSDAISDETVSGISGAERLSGADSQSACEASIELAEQLLDEGGSAEIVTVVDGRDPVYAAAANNLSGFTKGPLLVTNSTADSKRIVDFINKHASAIYYVDLLGEDDSLMSSDGFDLKTQITNVWDADATAASTDIAAGDTFEVDGTTFKVTAAASDDAEGQASVGTFYDGQRSYKEGDIVSYDGSDYALEADADVDSEVQDVIDQADALGTVTLASVDAIESARAAYEALTDDQKALVPYGTLEAISEAESTVEALKEQQTAEDEAAAQAVIDQIEALGTVTAASEDVITAAREAYDALTETQQALVTNYTTLTEAESTLAKIKKAAANAGGKVGKTYTAGKGASKATYKVTSNSKNTVTYVKCKASKKSVTVPSTVKIKGKTYKVTAVAAKALKGKKATKVTLGKNVKTIKKGAFKGSKVKTIVVKTKKLTKKSVKGSLKGSKVKTVKVNVGKTKVDKKYVKKYKKAFTKKNAGKKVTVK
ncbi:MAG: leucine-rich repeat protein [Coriobacteriales bacterium]